MFEVLVKSVRKSTKFPDNNGIEFYLFVSVVFYALLRIRRRLAHDNPQDAGGPTHVWAERKPTERLLGWYAALAR